MERRDAQFLDLFEQLPTRKRWLGRPMMHVPGYEISTDPGRLDRDIIHRFLSEESYWCPGIPRSVVETSIDHSLCFGIYHDGRLAGFARVVTDRATFALVADVFVLEPHRGKGLSKWLMHEVTQHPDLQGLRRLLLLTSDAHALYKQFGFGEIGNAWRFMEILRPDVYKRA
ncbi:GNAT family N-acetyltransferase [Labrys wisconsinensis]|uniref:GNAT superfamily N-acetyltransferase n=1 Tax=Labrys wisconsinensis TaxID=425677 RepID=A0ABU0J139_9HYPH|nr:GNAT family N-acetyltransferase [Labrys wisconsinensis]MDQ0467975.1 GNAT superfamily N-acetyltransferase [Labrys wisconsinensis]